MRNHIIMLIYFTSAALIGEAKPPAREPFGSALDRFATTYLQQCEEIMRELPVNYPEKDRDFENLSVYLRNIKTDDIPAIRRVLKEGKEAFDLPHWLRRLTTDIIGFRRVLDQLIIENLSNNNLYLERQFKAKLKKYWDDERYYSLYFNNEADLIEK